MGEANIPYLRFLGIGLIFFVLGCCVRTQTIAKDANYLDYLSTVSSFIGNFEFRSGIELAGVHLYYPFAFLTWQNNPLIKTNMPDVLSSGSFYMLAIWGIGCFFCYALYKRYNPLISHGSAAFANAKDLENMGLNANSSGVVCGKNPYNNQIMLHDGPEHIILVAPTRSGKGVGTIIPTAIIWKPSIFVFDPKAELWTATAGFRQKFLHQKVLKFEPLCKDGSAARWNPYAEINFQSFEELSDVITINETIVKTGEKSSAEANYWLDSAISLLNTVVLHLLYKHYQEKRELPCPTDVYSFITSPTLTSDQVYSSMMVYPHISPKEFLELEEDGKKYSNPLKNIYGVYYTDFKSIVEYLQMLKDQPLTQEEYDSIMKLPGIDPKEENMIAFENLRQAILKRKDIVKWKSPLNKIMSCTDAKEINAVIEKHPFPLYKLLVHPKIAEGASAVFKLPNDTKGSVIGSATTPMQLYQDPLIKRNTAVSDFCCRDLLDPKRTVSLYMILQPNDVDKLAPLTRLFVNTVIAKTVRDMIFDDDPKTKQRLLLMLDEFPALKKLDTIGNTLAICAGYGVKICTVVQNITQLNELYTKDGTSKILSNSQVQIYMTPSDYETAKLLSDTLGTTTIKTSSISKSGGIFGGGGSVSTSEQQRNLMNPDEILRLNTEKNQLVIVQGKKPVMAKKIKWFEEKYFKKRVFVIKPPVCSDVCTEVKNFTQLFKIYEAEVADVKAKQLEVDKIRKEREKVQSELASEEISGEADTVVQPEEGKDENEDVYAADDGAKNVNCDESQFAEQEAEQPEVLVSQEFPGESDKSDAWTAGTEDEIKSTEKQPTENLLIAMQIHDDAESKNTSAEFKEFMKNIKAGDTDEL